MNTQHHDGLRLRSSCLEKAGGIGPTSRRKAEDRFCRGWATADRAAAPPAALRRRGGGVQASHVMAIFAGGMAFVLAIGRSAAARTPDPVIRRASRAGATADGVPVCRSFVNVSNFVSLQNATTVDGACIDVLADVSFPTFIKFGNGRSIKIASSANAILDGGGSTSFFILEDAYLVLDSLTMAHGYTVFGGGAIFVNPPGQLDVANCRFLSNASPFFGGALNAAGTVDLSHCFFSDNQATNSRTGQGAAVSILGKFEASHCTFVDNTASARSGGGAVAVVAGTCIVTSCLFRHNGSPLGGAIVTFSATSVFSSTFEDNLCPGVGTGSAIYSQSGTLQLMDISISSDASSTACVIYSTSSSAVAVSLFYMTESQWMTDGNICALTAPLVYNSKMTPLVFGNTSLHAPLHDTARPWEIDDIPRCGDADIGDFCDLAYCTNEPPGFLGIQCYCPVDGKQVDPMLGSCVSQPHTFAPSSPTSPFPSPSTMITNSPTQQPSPAATPKQGQNDPQSKLFAGALALFSLLAFGCIVVCYYKRRGRDAGRNRAQGLELDTLVDGGWQMTQQSLLEAPSPPTSQLAYLEDSPVPAFAVDRNMRIALWSSGE